ncbi:dnaJ homolog subfamily C member 11 isoform X2 [Ixodes scapularis]
MAAHMDEEMDDDVLRVEDDYYAFLNVSKDASPEEITNAYRRLSKIYHPDKHADPLKKRDAETLFNKTRQAYDEGARVGFAMAAHMDEEMDDDVLRVEDDYYAFLNVSKDASPEEITNAYRRLSKIYHPDKHADPLKKRDAETLFNKTRQAYDVLADPHRRAIYDTLGTKGLDTEGWQVVQRTKTPQEIREEYERLAREQEERRMQQRTNPKGTISVGIDASDIFEAYYDEDDTRGFFPQMEINSMTFSQSIEAPLSLNDTVTLSGNLSTQNGNGSGSVTCSLRHLISGTAWSEFEIGAGNGLFGSVKGFKTISKRSFVSMQGMCQVTPIGLRPGCNAVLARQLGKHTVGYLTWKAGIQSCMNTTVIYDTSYGNFVASLQFGIPNTFAMMSYIYKFPDEGRLKGSIKVGTFGAVVEYGCERKISQHNTVGASMVIGIPTGITLKLKLNRASQTYMFPILLSEEPLPSAIFYGTITPLVGWYILQTFVIVPYTERQKRSLSKQFLKDYRPLTVTSTVYRTFAHIIKEHMAAWAEENELLTELQGGFRRG